MRLAGDAERLGIYGFGAAAHIVCQVAVHEGRRVFAFTRADDEAAQAFARELGAEWAGDALGPPPEELDGALIFAPAGELVPAALRAVAKGGTVVCGGIHMSDIPSMPYELLWGERVLRSVANLTRADAEEFLEHRAPGAGAHRGRDVPARAGERGARSPASRKPARRRRCSFPSRGLAQAARRSLCTFAPAPGRRRDSAAWKLSSPFATARHAERETAIPQCEAPISTSSVASGSRHERQSTIPSLFE